MIIFENRSILKKNIFVDGDQLNAFIWRLLPMLQPPGLKRSRVKQFFPLDTLLFLFPRDKILWFFFSYGANFSGGTPLYMVAERGFRDLVKIIIENTTLIPSAHTGPIRRTALHAAVVCHDPSTHILFLNL